MAGNYGTIGTKTDYWGSTTSFPSTDSTASTASSGGSAAMMGYASIFSNILGAIGSVYSGYQQNAVARYNRKVTDAQARLSEAQVGLISANAAIRNTNAKKEMEQVAGTQIASYAKAGVKFTGSPIDVVMSSRANLELDYALNNINDSITASGYLAQAGVQRAQGVQYKAAGYNAIATGYGSATKSLISAGVKSALMNNKDRLLGSDTIGGGWGQ